MIGDLGKMLRLAGELKAKLPQLRRQLAEAEYSAEAGEGAVRATVNGKMELVDLHIAPSVLAGGQDGCARLAELVKSAVAGAQARAAERAASAMKELTGGMDLPGLGEMLP